MTYRVDFKDVSTIGLDVAVRVHACRRACHLHLERINPNLANHAGNGLGN